jgi:acetyltransferase EpsM
MFDVKISGNVTIGEGTLIGSGAIILPNLKIGKWCKIGAGL